MKLELNALVEAGWYSMLVFVGFIVVYYLAFLAISSFRPPWVLPFLGKDVTWTLFDEISLFAIVSLKIGFVMFFVVLTWLTMFKDICAKNR